jgi:hypothetical protein
LPRPLIKNGTIPHTTTSISLEAYRQKKCGMIKEEMETTVLEESWRQNVPVGPTFKLLMMMMFMKYNHKRQNIP